MAGRTPARAAQPASRPSSGWCITAAGRATPAWSIPALPEKLAAYAGAVARRYPWIDHYTPVNEPCTTARFCGLYGLWYPHQQSDAGLCARAAQPVQGRGAVDAGHPRRQSQAKLVQTDDLGKTYSTPEMAGPGALLQRPPLARPWDLLCGMVGENHALWRYLRAAAPAKTSCCWFSDHPCPPDIIGVNYYVTSERWLDHRGERYPQQEIGAVPRHTPTSWPRALATPRPGIGAAAGRSLGALRPAAGRHRSAHRRQPRRPVALAAGDLAGRQRSAT
jgi:dTDP-4-dehydrorhamnose reductase